MSVAAPGRAGRAAVRLTSQTRIIAADPGDRLHAADPRPDPPRPPAGALQRDLVRRRPRRCSPAPPSPACCKLVADAMGVRDTNVALFSIVLLLLLGLALNFSVIMSRQAAQITRLAQERAIERPSSRPTPTDAGTRPKPRGVRSAQAKSRASRKKSASRASSSETFRSRPRRVSWTSCGARAGPAGVDARGLRAQPSSRSRLKTTSSAPRGEGGEVAQPGGAELEAEVEDLGAAAATGAFGPSAMSLAVRLSPAFDFLLERFAGGALRHPPRPPGAVEQRAPGRAGELAGERRGDAALSTSARSSRPRSPRAAGAPARGRRRRAAPRRRSPPARLTAPIRSPAAIAASCGFEHLGRERREVDRLAARGDRLQQRLGLGAEQDQVDEARAAPRASSAARSGSRRASPRRPRRRRPGARLRRGGRRRRGSPARAPRRPCAGRRAARARRGRDAARGRAGRGGGRRRGRRRRSARISAAKARAAARLPAPRGPRKR